MSRTKSTNGNSNWCRQFQVTDHVERKNGTVLFKITSVVYPSGKPEAAAKITVWRKFKDFRNVHAELKKRHALLRISEQFPICNSPSIFQKNKDVIIQTRKESILNLLNFVSKHPALFTADVFVQFFKNGYLISDIDCLEEPKPEINDYSSFFKECRSVLSAMGQAQGVQSANYSSQPFVNEGEFKVSDGATPFYPENADFKCGKNISSFSGMPEYCEEAIAHANEAHQQQIIGNYEISFSMYKTAIVCLLSGVQGETSSSTRMKVKEITSQYLLQAEWLFHNHLIYNVAESEKPRDNQIPWRPRSELKRYKVIRIVDTKNILVQDVVENVTVVIKGILKANYPVGNVEKCIIPKEVPYMVKLYGTHESDSTVFLVLQYLKYGKLWNYLEMYREKGFGISSSENQSPDGDHDGRQSVASTISTNNNSVISRLDSSIYSDLSCESLASHDENYFDLVEDYARIRNKKLREIQDFHERRTQIQNISKVKKTSSQLDLKSLDDCSHYRTQSLSDLAGPGGGGDGYFGDEECASCSSKEEVFDADNPDHDMDTQKLLWNAQKLIESINATLSKSMIEAGEEVVESVSADCEQSELECGMKLLTAKHEEVECNSDNGLSISDVKNAKECDSPASESASVATEDHSIRSVLLHDGLNCEMVVRWAAHILMAIDALHQRSIVCRDLYSDNVLLADDGSATLTYFLRYPGVNFSLNKYAKRKLFVAPEVVNSIFSNTSEIADWWSYGVILYEMITLQSFSNSHPTGIYSHSIINIPKTISVEAHSLLSQLLKVEPSERLGAGFGGVEDIKMHPYFKNIKWDQL